MARTEKRSTLILVMVEPKREKTLNVRMLDEELAMLDAVAANEGISVSAWVRQHVRAAYRKLSGDVKPKPKPKTR